MNKLRPVRFVSFQTISSDVAHFPATHGCDGNALAHLWLACSSTEHFGSKGFLNILVHVLSTSFWVQKVEMGYK